eukprot:551301-Prorocentrum_minimum.AAC.1
MRYIPIKGPRLVGGCGLFLLRGATATERKLVGLCADFRPRANGTATLRSDWSVARIYPRVPRPIGLPARCDVRESRFGGNTSQGWMLRTGVDVTGGGGCYGWGLLLRAHPRGRARGTAAAAGPPGVQLWSRSPSPRPPPPAARRVGIAARRRTRENEERSTRVEVRLLQLSASPPPLTPKPQNFAPTDNCLDMQPPIHTRQQPIHTRQQPIQTWQPLPDGAGEELQEGD